MAILDPKPDDFRPQAQQVSARMLNDMKRALYRSIRGDGKNILVEDYGDRIIIRYNGEPVVHPTPGGDDEDGVDFCDVFASLRHEDCLLVTGPENSVTLRYDDIEDGWLSTEELKYPGGSGIVTFWYEGGKVRLGTYLPADDVEPAELLELLYCGDGCWRGGPLTGHEPPLVRVINPTDDTTDAEVCPSNSFEVCVECAECTGHAACCSDTPIPDRIYAHYEVDLYGGGQGPVLDLVLNWMPHVPAQPGGEGWFGEVPNNCGTGTFGIAVYKILSESCEWFASCDGAFIYGTFLATSVERGFGPGDRLGGIMGPPTGPPIQCVPFHFTTTFNFYYSYPCGTCSLHGTHHLTLSARPITSGTSTAQLKDSILRCKHRGVSLGLVDCPSCTGNVKAVTNACDLHGVCTMFSKPVPGVYSCNTCPDAEAP